MFHHLIRAIGGLVLLQDFRCADMLVCEEFVDKIRHPKQGHCQWRPSTGYLPQLIQGYPFYSSYECRHGFIHYMSISGRTRCTPSQRFTKQLPCLGHKSVRVSIEPGTLLTTPELGSLELDCSATTRHKSSLSMKSWEIELYLRLLHTFWHSVSCQHAREKNQ